MIRYILTIILLIFPLQANAILKLNITDGNIEPLPIAIPFFTAGTAENTYLAQEITEIIEADLENSGLFASINRRAFIQKINGADTIPQFSDWRQINAQTLVTGGITELANGNIKAEFRVWDILSEKLLIQRYFISKNWRRISHKIADEIYMRLTGEEAYFDSRILYISESGSWRKPVKRLAIMDQDGANRLYLTSGRDMALTPRFDPSSQRIIYMSYHGGKPSVYLYQLETGKVEILGKFPGMSYAPRFSADGKRVVMSVSINGNSEIYTMDIASRRKEKITKNSAIDTSPSFSPDGKRIVFNSDRGGSQQLYIMDSDGDDVERISFGKGSYATPVWSPRGDLIAFTKMYKGRFYIGVIRPDGSGERLLTESFLDEGPTWSPNGRVIIFTRQTPSTSLRQGKSSLYSIDLTGYNERKLYTPQRASDPAWSPLLSK